MPHTSRMVYLDTPPMQSVECPCCHGRGRLVVHDEAKAITRLLLACKVCAGLGDLVAEQCTHCMGAGRVVAYG
jgi:DnaJ-class molecular chaperone